ncbi:hypothetical protein GUJ93_ZPchr0006g45147 [Zizania palustris]|uniref:Uncharacterized protein n=1 Tax=Zizania palustris TaxID=103762 RepID=A0A8J5TAC2_ZIZPA|nr:hypothetical protein GUJ93_ZPchr0006g45147 [Zizania palustris]
MVKMREATTATASTTREAAMDSGAAAEVGGYVAPIEIDSEEQFVEIVARRLEELLVVANGQISGEDDLERVGISVVELEPNPWVPVRRLHRGFVLSSRPISLQIEKKIT